MNQNLNTFNIIIHLNYSVFETLFLLISFQFSQNCMIGQNC